MSGNRVAVALCFVLALCTAFTAAPVGAADDGFYKGKTVNVIVGFGPGGGNDLYARMLARHMSKYIPGSPNFIVQNMPGAGSLTAVRNLDTNSPRDGTAMVTFQSGTITQSLVTPDKVNIDFRNYSWIGVANGELRVCYGYGANAVKTWDDMMSRKEFVLGTTAKGSASYVNGATMRRVFNAPVKQVMGYPGAAEQRLALERGELDGSCGSINSIPEDWMRDRKAHIFVHFTEARSPDLPESSVYIGSVAKTDEQKQLLTILNATDQLGRTFIMSKQVPPDRITIMRRAFDQTMKDKDFLADAEKQKLPIDPLTGEQVEAIVASMLAASPAVIANAKEIYD